MTTNVMTQIPQNYKKQVDWVLQSYQDAGAELANGFQKDAIQNCAGARKTNKWNRWKCEFYFHEYNGNKYLVVEDSGTQGLTGPNISAEEIHRKMDNDEEFASDWRLARFSSMHNSGGNTTGAGKYGVGKTIYAAASKDYSYYFDSLTADGKYVANFLDKGHIFSLALEEDNANKLIKDGTGLSPKTSVGTRVIIVNPKEELIEAINNGEMVKFIQQSWWRIIERLGSNSYISVNGKKVVCPSFPVDKYTYNLPAPEDYATGYRVKHFSLHILDSQSNDWQGIAYYRKGMQIGYVDIADVPEKVKGKYWGYIEVDEDWENALADIEDAVHFGVSRGKKGTTTYQNLKRYCNEKFNALMVSWGIVKQKESEDHKLQSEFNDIAEEVQDLFNNLGFEDLGKGAKRPDFDVRWQKITFPTNGSPEVTTGEKISFEIKIASNYIVKKKFEYVLEIVDKDKNTISTIKKEGVQVEPGKPFVKSFIFSVDSKKAKQYAENRITLTVKVAGSGRAKSKEIPFFYDVAKPDNSRESVLLTLHTCQFPREGSRRINYDETLKDVSYRIENKRPDSLSFQLNVSIHDARETSCPMIVNLGGFIAAVNAYEEVVVNIPDIFFGSAVYSKILDKGELELRARVIAASDSGDYEKGDRITHYKYSLYLNCDEKNGKKDAFTPKQVKAPDDPRRSWYETNGSEKLICLNVSHPAFNIVRDYNELQRNYIREHMLRQYVLLYLHEEKYSMFLEDGKTFADYDIADGNQIIERKIEKVLSESFRR